MGSRGRRARSRASTIEDLCGQVEALKAGREMEDRLRGRDREGATRRRKVGRMRAGPRAETIKTAGISTPASRRCFGGVGRVRLSTKGRYAVMAMVDLASFGGRKPVSLADIADRQEISLSYLEQLFGKLRKGGLVRSVRGPGGGYLGATLADTRISDIVMAADEPLRATRCKTVRHRLP